jgi:DNA-binding transcriptional ArsR family regulator
MKEGPDIARLGSLLGDPARANMLNALMDGRALTVSELAASAGVGLPTASAHLSQLESGGLLTRLKQGRHRYYAIANSEIGALLEQFMSFADALGHKRLQTGPKDGKLRKARVCYNHLAGEMGVALFEGLLARRHLAFDSGSPVLTATGCSSIAEFGIELAELEKKARPLCRSCLDWSERRTHLAGSVGQALLERMLELGWARREKDSRVVQFSPSGEMKFNKLFAGAFQS